MLKHIMTYTYTIFIDICCLLKIYYFDLLLRKKLYLLRILLTLFPSKY